MYMYFKLYQNKRVLPIKLSDCMDFRDISVLSKGNGYTMHTVVLYSIVY